MPTHFTEDVWVVAAEVRVEDWPHVHHAVVTIQAPGGNKPLNALDVVESEGTFLEDVRLWALHRHMHVRRKEITYTAISPGTADARSCCACRSTASIGSWNYHLAEAKMLPKCTKLLVTAHFDNSSSNKDNPHLAATVRYGD